MNKTTLASAKILSLVAQGKTLTEAFNIVLGVGAFEKLAGEVYDTLRAEASMREQAENAFADTKNKTTKSGEVSTKITQ